MTKATDTTAPTAALEADDAACNVPFLTHWRLFLRFLRFGALAWGGPVAQIAILRQELVDEEHWVSSAHFNRVLAVYQVLPGPEAHELCVYFGMRARGRWGGVLAGFGFMLPGFVLMFALSWAYVRFGLHAAGVAAVFAAVQLAVAALIVRAVGRIGSHVVTDGLLLAIAIVATAAQLAGLHFGVTLAVGGLVYALAGQGFRRLAWALAAAALAAVLLCAVRAGGFAGLDVSSAAAGPLAAAHRHGMPLPALFWSGLKAGLLTFGGAYTAIPFLQRDAVTQGAWMSNAQFLDGLALSGILPAPLIIFSTFVGYVGGGPAGALAMTAGIFLPAFAFTLVGHDALERAVHQPRVRRFLEGLTAAVVGLIAGTTLGLLKARLVDAEALLVFAVALGVLFVSKSRWVVPAVIAAAAVWGALSLALGAR